MDKYLNTYYKDCSYKFNRIKFYIFESIHKNVLEKFKLNNKLSYIIFDNDVIKANGNYKIHAYTSNGHFLDNYEIPIEIIVRCYTCSYTCTIFNKHKYIKDFCDFIEFFKLFYGKDFNSINDIIKYRLTLYDEISDIVRELDNTLIFKNLIEYLKNCYLKLNRHPNRFSKRKSNLESYIIHEKKIINSLIAIRK